MSSALDKVLSLGSGGSGQVGWTEDEGARRIRAAAKDLDELALLLADSDDDEDGDGEGDDDEDEDSDDPKAKFKAMLKKKKAKAGAKKVKATALLLDAMIELSGLQGGDQLSLSVLTQAEREKPGAHTIAGSTDFPIPDARPPQGRHRPVQAGRAGRPLRLRGQEAHPHLGEAAGRLGRSHSRGRPLRPAPAGGQGRPRHGHGPHGARPAQRGAQPPAPHHDRGRRRALSQP